MNAIELKRPLNHAFKRFQRLPELPKIQMGANAAMQSFGQARPLNNEANHTRGAGEAQFTEDVTG